jgi:acetyl esterase
MPVDPQARLYLDRLASLGVPPVNHQTVSEARTTAESTADELFGVKDTVGAIREATIPGPRGHIPVRIYTPTTGDSGAALVYFHGGGWVFGSVNTHDGVCRALARRAGLTVVSVNYRLAPEHRFPAALEDAWIATRWAVEHASARGMHPRLAVGGDSAGGNLAAVVALRARDAGVDLRLQVLICPVTDCRMRSASYEEFARGYGLTRAEMEWFLNHYLPSPFDRSDPAASPLCAMDHRDVAPAYVITAEYDPLRDEGEAYVVKLQAAGVSVQLRRYEGMIHGFYRMGSVFNQTHEALTKCADALRISLGTSGAVQH